MDKTMRFDSDMRATMAPDVYDGDSCDKVRPRWVISHDKGGDEELDAVELDSRHFPPGTQIVINIPCCPDCGVSADFTFGGGDAFNWHDDDAFKCECGFDWRTWTDENYA